MPLLEDLYAKQRARQVELLPFFYSIDFTNSVVAANTTITQNVSIQADSHFVARYFNITAYNTPNFTVIQLTPPLLINFFDSGSGRTLQDNPQPIQNLCGGNAAGTANGHLPFILPEPWLLRAASTAQVTLVNIGITVFPRIIVSLVGFKAFRFGATGPADI